MRFHRLAAALLAVGFFGAAPLAAQQPPPDPVAAEVEQLRDRVAWTNRMALKGYVSAEQVREEHARLKAAEARLARQAAGDPATKTAPAPEKTVPAGPMWEYKVFNRGEITDLGNQDFATGLNKLGDEGWEMVALGQGVRAAQEYYFKRPKARAAGEAGKAGAAKPEHQDGENIIFRLKNLSAVDFAKTADALLGGKGGSFRLVAEPVTNSVLAYGTARQIAELRTLIEALDVPDAAVGAAEVVPQLEMYHLKSAKVLDVVKVLQDVYGKDAKTHRMGADERTNTLILRGPLKLLDEILRTVKELDVPAAKDGDRKNP
jgi:type II secretory pathway component GspD/PulD (secretin)